MNVAALAALPGVLARFGIPAEPILAAAGLSRDDLLDPKRTVTFAQLDELLGSCLRATDCPHVGLLLGAQIGLKSLGLVGRIAATADTVGEGLHHLSRSYLLQSSGGAPSVEVAGPDATLSYAIYAARFRNAHAGYDLTIAGLCNIMRELCGPTWHADAVYLPRRRPKDLRPYRECFGEFLGTRLYFNASQASLVFPAAILAKRSPHADSLVHELLVEHARSGLLQRDPLLVADVRRTIRQVLATGSCSRREVARRLGMHERALGRRLQATGSSYQALLEEARVTMAEGLLETTDASIVSIAVALGYRDSTVFARAFRRWHGLTPREYRNRRTKAQAVDPPVAPRRAAARRSGG